MGENSPDSLRVQGERPDGHVPVVGGFDHVAHCCDLVESESARPRAWTTRSVIERARLLSSSPRVIAGFREADDSEGVRKWNACACSVDGSEKGFFLPPSGNRSRSRSGLSEVRMKARSSLTTCRRTTFCASIRLRRTRSVCSSGGSRLTTCRGPRRIQALVVERGMFSLV